MRRQKSIHIFSEVEFVNGVVFEYRAYLRRSCSTVVMIPSSTLDHYPNNDI